MIIPTLAPHFRLKATLISASISLASVAGLLTPSMARADVTVSVDQGRNSSQHSVSSPTPSKGTSTGGNSGGPGGGYGGMGKGGSTAKTDTLTGSTFYTISVRNLSANPVKGVVVEYHVYNKTTTSGNGQSTVTLDDITNSVTVDLAGNEVKQVETSDIPHVVTNSTSSGSSGGSGGGYGGKKGGGGSSSGGPSSSVQDVMGWVVYLKFNGKTVHTFQGPTDDVIDKAAQYLNKKQGV